MRLRTLVKKSYVEETFEELNITFLTTYRECFHVHGTHGVIVVNGSIASLKHPQKYE
jgi:hypothetical protein